MNQHMVLVFESVYLVKYYLCEDKQNKKTHSLARPELQIQQYFREAALQHQGVKGSIII